MQTYDEILKQLNDLQDNAAGFMMEVREMKENVSEKEGVITSAELNDMPMVPFGAYEMQLERYHDEKRQLLDRFDKEKDKMREQFQKEKTDMRKHYRQIVAWVSAILVAFIAAGVFAVSYVLHNFEFSTYQQDVEYGNANLIGNDGDIVNGEAVYPDYTTEVSSSQGNGN